jgi:hypothetical protein
MVVQKHWLLGGGYPRILYISALGYCIFRPSDTVYFSPRILYISDLAYLVLIRHISWWRLFQKCVMRTKLDIYVLISLYEISSPLKLMIIFSIVCHNGSTFIIKGIEYSICLLKNKCLKNSPIWMKYLYRQVCLR